MVSFDDKLFQPRFLLQDLVFAHSKELETPSIDGSLLHKGVCLAMRGVGGCEQKILLVSFILRKAQKDKDGPETPKNGRAGLRPEFGGRVLTRCDPLPRFPRFIQRCHRQSSYVYPSEFFGRPLASTESQGGTPRGQKSFTVLFIFVRCRGQKEVISRKANCWDYHAHMVSVPFRDPSKISPCHFHGRLQDAQCHAAFHAAPANFKQSQPVSLHVEDSCTVQPPSTCSSRPLVSRKTIAGCYGTW